MTALRDRVLVTLLELDGALGEVPMGSVMERLGVDGRAARDAMFKLKGQRLVEFVARMRTMRPGGWRLTERGATAARHAQQAMAAGVKPVAATPTQQRLWRAMRLARKFTLADLLGVLLDAEKYDRYDWARERRRAQLYLRALARAGYLVALGGARGEATRWLLARDSGAIAPAIVWTQEAAFDANTGETFALAREAA